MTGRLHPEDIEAIARRVAELVDDLQPSPAGVLMDVKTLATRLNVSTAFVYEHAAELGGVKLSGSPKAPWRFDLERATAAMQERSTPVPPPRTTSQRRPPSVGTTPSGLPLLPIKGQAA